MTHTHKITIGSHTVNVPLLRPPETLEDGTVVLAADVLADAELKALLVIFRNAVGVDGVVLKMARKTIGLAVDRLADILHISPSNIKSLEKGGRKIGAYTQEYVHSLLKRYAVEHMIDGCKLEETS